MTVGHKIVGTGKEHVLIMHDWFCDCSSYDYILPLLDTKTFTFAFMDLRGYGSSKSLQGEFSAPEASKDALELVDKLGWSRFHVVGHSMSGMIAQRIAIDAGSRIKSVTAITPTPACGSKAPPEVISNLTDAARDNDGVALQVAHYLTGNQYSDLFASFKVKQWRNTSTAQARVAYLHMFSFTDFSAEAQGLQTPILVIHGQHDPRPESELKTLFGGWYPNFEIVSLPGTGHYPMQETPAHLATQMDTFWRRYM